jgi:uncharacterized pyridoxamine 5'-phosphate oxidase family protein
MPLSQSEIDQLLIDEQICYIATTRPDGSPHIAPIWFVYYQSKIYFETDETTVKFKNIQKNNKVAICFGGRETLIIEGLVKYFKEKETKVPFRKLLWEKYGQDMDDSYITDQTLIFEVVLSKQLSWHYADQSWE